jgi:hypothetical protein
VTLETDVVAFDVARYGATAGVVDALRRRSGRITSLGTYLHMHAAIVRRWVHE